jgi:hypothetical protein
MRPRRTTLGRMQMSDDGNDGPAIRVVPMASLRLSDEVSGGLHYGVCVFLGSLPAAVLGFR